jgi:hypothetical protein
MVDSFDVNVAKEYGIYCAILLEYIHARMNTHDGDRYWMRESVKTIHENIPYMSEKQIRSSLDKMVDGGILMVGNYNEDPHDRTKWYTFTRKGYSLKHKNVGGG